MGEDGEADVRLARSGMPDDVPLAGSGANTHNDEAYKRAVKELREARWPADIAVLTHSGPIHDPAW